MIDKSRLINAVFSLDLASVMAVSGKYVTVEKYVEAKYDLKFSRSEISIGL